MHKMRIVIDEYTLKNNINEISSIINNDKNNNIFILYYLGDTNNINIKNIKLEKINEDIKNVDVDKFIINTIDKNINDFLITENQLLLAEVQKPGIMNKILSIDDANELFNFNKNIGYSPKIGHDTVNNLNINDPIFDKLKMRYNEFEQWFDQISGEKRECYVYYKNDKSLGGLAIIKIENENIDLKDKVLPKKLRLKISTFIITLNKYKLGELFIKIIIDYSISKNIHEIYLTHFVEDNDSLVYLIESYGFINAGKNGRCENVFIKNLMPKNKTGNIRNINPENILKLDKLYYPGFYDGKNANKFIIPIKPLYHDRLFYNKSNQYTLPEYDDIPLTERNAIKKAYISHSKINNIMPGDILIFYRSEDLKALAHIGIAEEAVRLKTKEDIVRKISKRSVYTENEIENRKSLVILFLSNFELRNYLNLNELEDNGILKGPPQSIMKIDDRAYEYIKKVGGINDDFTFS